MSEHVDVPEGQELSNFRLDVSWGWATAAREYQDYVGRPALEAMPVGGGCIDLVNPETDRVVVSGEPCDLTELK